MTKRERAGRMRERKSGLRCDRLIDTGNAAVSLALEYLLEEYPVSTDAMRHVRKVLRLSRAGRRRESAGFASSLIDAGGGAGNPMAVIRASSVGSMMLNASAATATPGKVPVSSAQILNSLSEHSRVVRRTRNSSVRCQSTLPSVSCPVRLSCLVFVNRLRPSISVMTHRASLWQPKPKYIAKSSQLAGPSRHLWLNVSWLTKTCSFGLSATGRNQPHRETLRSHCPAWSSLMRTGPTRPSSH